MNALATLYNNQKRFDEAAAMSAKAGRPAAPGGTADAVYNQGIILWNQGKIAEAKTKFEEAIKADPNHADAHYQLGMALLNEGKMPEAVGVVRVVPEAGAHRPVRHAGEDDAGAAEDDDVSVAERLAAGARARRPNRRRCGRAGAAERRAADRGVEDVPDRGRPRRPTTPGSAISARTRCRKPCRRSTLRPTCRSGGTSSATCSRTRRERPRGGWAGSTRSTAWTCCGEWIDVAAGEGRTRSRVLIQVDLALEATKHGARVEDVPAMLAAAAGMRGGRARGLDAAATGGGRPGGRAGRGSAACASCATAGCRTARRPTGSTSCRWA